MAVRSKRRRPPPARRRRAYLDDQAGYGPWETSLALQPLAAIRGAETPADSPVRFIIDAAERALQDDRNASREILRRLDDSKLGAEALCAAGDVALCIREPAWAHRFFEMAAYIRADWYRPHLGLGSAAMAQFDFDNAVKSYVNARDRTKNRRLKQMLSAAVRDLQQIKSVG